MLNTGKKELMGVYINTGKKELMGVQVKRS